MQLQQSCAEQFSIRTSERPICTAAVTAFGVVAADAQDSGLRPNMGMRKGIGMGYPTPAPHRAIGERTEGRLGYRSGYYQRAYYRLGVLAALNAIEAIVPGRSIDAAGYCLVAAASFLRLI